MAEATAPLSARGDRTAPLSARGDRRFSNSAGFHYDKADSISHFRSSSLHAVYIYMYTYICVAVHIYIYMYIYIYVHMCIYAYIYHRFAPFMWAGRQGGLEASMSGNLCGF